MRKRIEGLLNWYCSFQVKLRITFHLSLQINNSIQLLSEESCKDVAHVIRRVKPDVVVLEICKERMSTLVLDEEVLMERIMNFSLDQASEIIKNYGVLQGIIQILFLYVSREITKQTKMLPGSEIRRVNYK